MRARSLFACLAASLLLAACGDDPASSTDDDVGGGDASLEVGGGDTGDDATDAADAPDPDAGDTDPEPDAAPDAEEDAEDDTSDATEPDADAGDEVGPDVDATDATDAADAPLDVAVDTIEDTAPDVAEDTEPLPDVWSPPASPLDYPYDTLASVATSIGFAAPGTGLSVDGDETPDNATGELLTGLSGILSVDIDEELQAAVDDGLLLIGVGWVGGDPTDDLAAIEAHILQMSDGDDNPATRTSYFVESETFIPGTGEPYARFIGPTLASRFVSEPASLALSLPFGIFSIDATVGNAIIDAVVERDALGVAVTQGRIAGIVPGEDIFVALNGYLSSDSCACLGLDGDAFEIGEEGAAECVVDDAGTCASDDPCAQLVNFCDVVTVLLETSYDQNLGGLPKNDGLSVNLTFEAVGTELLGFDP